MNSKQLNELLSNLTLEQVMAEKYRRSLREFTKAAWPTIEPGVDFQNNWHIDAISDHLEAVVNGDIKRLIINVPPRHMKSISVGRRNACMDLGKPTAQEVPVRLLRSLPVNQG
jgi:hypothetical protein